MNWLAHFTQVWVVDFEYRQPPGHRPEPHCVVARELMSGRVVWHWLHERPAGQPPYPVDKQTLIITYYGTAELNCHLVLGWPLPMNHIDLYAEFKLKTCGNPNVNGYGLIDAMLFYGLDFISATEKAEMRELAIRGGPFTKEEEVALIDYCQRDVDATAQLAEKMGPSINLAQALIRGRYEESIAGVEMNGVPIDFETLSLIRKHWDEIKEGLIKRIDLDGVYENGVFRQRRWEEWLSVRGIIWPRLESGALDLDKDTFRDMAEMYPAVAPYRELRATLHQLKLHDLPVGPDGRNRTMLSPFSSKTGRNQPKTNGFIFALAKWLRTLVRPEEGRALAYLDYEQQEFGIAAALSRDQNMMEAYTSGDPYLTFAKQARAVPSDATRDSHPNERALLKSCCLGVQYGMGEQTLAIRIKQSPAHARELINLHKAAFPTYWRWSEGAQDSALMNGCLTSSFGWSVRTAKEPNPCFLRNFLLQANGAEILRLACILATEAGVILCAPVHDALLIEASEEDIDVSVAKCEAAMQKAGEIVLKGFVLRVETKIIRYPDHFPVPEGSKIRQEIFSLLDEITKAGHSFPRLEP